jgi:hypothetical protein
MRTAYVSHLSPTVKSRTTIPPFVWRNFVTSPFELSVPVRISMDKQVSGDIYLDRYRTAAAISLPAILQDLRWLFPSTDGAEYFDQTLVRFLLLSLLRLSRDSFPFVGASMREAPLLRQATSLDFFSMEEKSLPYT